jgi:hypothetical protein
VNVSIAQSNITHELKPLTVVDGSAIATLRVLILEDTHGDSALAESIRSEAPLAAVSVTQDAHEAVRLAASAAFELLIVATPLSADFGSELLAKFERRNPHSEVIVMACDTWMAQSAENSAERGLHVLSAPLNPLFIIEILRSCCARMQKVVPGVWDEEDEGHFVVVLRRHTPIEVVQLKCLSAATTALDFIRPQGACGRIWFENGEVVHAEAGKVSGEDAFVEMMNWTAGSIVEIMAPPPSQKTIAIPWNALLMHAAQMADERQARLQTA